MTKRKLNIDAASGGLSPPPAKKTAESTTTNKIVANFFTPTSKKEPAPLSWRIVHETLLVGKYGGEKRDQSKDRGRKIAAFDFDSTLIRTSSGNVFGKDPSDWRWWDSCVPGKLRSLYLEGYVVVILSNQGGISLKSNPKSLKSDQKRLSDFKTKVGHVFNHLDIPISIYAATAADHFRKPRLGMWNELLDDYDLDINNGPELSNSFFVGDAAGRLARKGSKADHSSSDRNFAVNIRIDFKTPEEYFLMEEPAPWTRTFEPSQFLNDVASIEAQDATNSLEAPFQKANDLEIVLFCGSPGSGKSTFYFRWLKPQGYERVNQDILKTRDKCLKVAAELIKSGKSVAVDNTNADKDTRNKWIELSKNFNVPIRCICLDTPAAVCRHNDTVRALNSGTFNPESRQMLPGMAFSGFNSRYQEPAVEEGFQDVVRINFTFRGDEVQQKIWTKYWL